MEARCEQGVLALLLGMLFFAPLAFGAVDAWALWGVAGLGAGIFTLWLTRLWLARDTKLLLPPLTWVVAAFSGYAIWQYTRADIEYVARNEVFLALFYALLFLVVVNTLRGRTEATVVSYGLIAVGTLEGGYAIAQALSRSHLWTKAQASYGSRYGGTYVCPNHFAGLMELLLPLALAYLLVGKCRIVTRILLGYAVLTMLAGLSVSFSRGGYVGAAMGLGFLFLLLLAHRNHRRKALLCLVVLGLAGGLYLQQYLRHTESFGNHVALRDAQNNQTYDFNARLLVWRAAEQMWLDHPWWGVGPAHFDYRYREYRPVDEQKQPDRVHNDYLNLLADWGVVGGVIVLLGMITAGWGVFRTWPQIWRKEKDVGSSQSNRLAFFLGSTGGLLAIAVHSFMDFNLHIPANAIVCVVLLGGLSSQLRFSTNRYWVSARLPVKVLTTLVVVCMLGAISCLLWREGRETLWLSRAARADVYSAERKANLEHAFAAESHNDLTAYEVGECLRIAAFQGGTDNEEQAREAISWYQKAMGLNPYNGYYYLRCGMAWDWLGDHERAAPYFIQAEKADPNGYYMVANLGWHYVQVGDYAAARQYFIRGIRLRGENLTAQNYLYDICLPRMRDRAAGQPQFPAFF